MTDESRKSRTKETSIAKSGKHVSAVTNNHATTEELLEAAFPVRSVPRLYNENQSWV
jgi:hypothetical protein